jgi:hypothetical protein
MNAETVAQNERERNGKTPSSLIAEAFSSDIETIGARCYIVRVSYNRPQVSTGIEKVPAVRFVFVVYVHLRRGSKSVLMRTPCSCAYYSRKKIA